MPTWSIWMKMPGGTAGEGWSRVAGGLSEDDAINLAAKFLFQARAMPDETKDGA